MSTRRSLTERRLTEKQVAGLLVSGAIPRPDLEKTFVDAKIGLRPPSIYELRDGHILVAYVGEVIRTRTKGDWMIAAHNEPYPYIGARKHSVIMPVNVVWSELGGLDRADLRREAANEVRRARATYLEYPTTA